METMLLKTLFSLLFLAFLVSDVSGAKMTLYNKCSYPVWPATQPSDDHVPLETGGFYLASKTSRTLNFPSPWSGRVWGRQGCSFDSTGHGHCETGDCNKLLSCNGEGKPPATLIEITLGKALKDYYDVSLVEGYNLPISFAPINNRNCRVVRCVMDLIRVCPKELKLWSKGGRVVGCTSACDNQVDFDGSEICRPTKNSEIFKNTCPNAYTFIPDNDPNILARCTEGGNYLLTFCP